MAQSRWTLRVGERSRSSRLRSTPTPPRSPGRARSSRLSAAGVRRRGAQAQGRARQGAGRRKRSCCRLATAPSASASIRPTTSATSCRVFLQMADGCADLRDGVAGGQGRPHRRQFCQARSSDVETRRRNAARLSRRHRQRHRVQRRKRARPTRAASLEGLLATSAASLNLLRAFATGGYANLENVHRWMLGFVKTARSPSATRSSPTASPRRSPSCARSASIRRRAPNCGRPDFYTSHEALLLGYEQAMTRLDSTSRDYYATSGHMVWIGDRTRQLGGAHVEYCRG